MTDGTELLAGRYRLLSQVGRGAMGVVWRARDERLGRTVAVKQLRAPIGMSSTQIEQAHLRARREARIAARLQHPHAVALYDVVEHEGRPCLVMEYVPSSSLSEVLAGGRVLTGAEVAAIGAQLASALAAAHEAGIVHRDVKPANILMTEGGSVKLTDFGISRASGDVTVTATGEMLGTPAYTSPEVAQGRAARSASDVFSLGATLYAALEGEPPFGTGPNAMALLLRIVNGEMRPPEHTGPLTQTLLWMLRNDPAERPSMDLVRRELESVTADTVTVMSVPDLEDGVDGVDGEGGDIEADDGIDAGSDADADAKVETGKAVESTAAAQDDAEPAIAAADDASGEAASPVPAAPATPAAPAPSSSPQRSRVRSRLVPVALLAVVGALTAGIVAAITASGGSGGSAGASTSTTSTARAAQSSHSATATTATATAASGKPSATSAAASASSAAATPPASVAQQMTSMITRYYGLMPGDLGQAWGYLTADYQQNHAGGMTGYRAFWDQIQHVSIADVVADPPSTVQATIVYSYKNGQTVQERTSFGLVEENGAWKIASSSVLSSKTL